MPDVYIYKVQFELTGTNGLILEDEIELGDFKLKGKKSDMFESKMIGELEIKLDKENFKLAKDIAMKKIQQELLPLLILSSKVGYSTDWITVELRPIIKRDGKSVTVVSIGTVQICDESQTFKKITKEGVKTYLKELNSYKDKIDKLSKEDKENFLRAVRFWNRGKIDNDKIDKFLNFYIAFEILGKNLVKNDKQWVKEVCESHDLKRKYDGVKIDDIRHALVHAKHKLSKENAEKLAIKYADEFGDNVFKLIKIFLDKRIST